MGATSLSAGTPAYQVAGCSPDTREAQWVRPTENPAEDEERQTIWHLRRLVRLVREDADDPEDVEHLERVQACITRTIEQLTAVSEAITEARGD